ncbi:non-contractile tail sheath protein, partial [Acinetobacter johnsonii]|nr:hypothetical protein [Acinetobacter johnsonii]
MAMNWNEILNNTNNLNDVLSILKKILAQMGDAADGGSISEAIKEIEKIKGEVSSLSTFVKQELPINVFDVDEQLIPRFSADCWTIDGPRSMSFCLVGEAEDAFDVYFTSRRQNDFAAAIFFSEDQAMHPYLA